ncbi:hypothetical protein D3C87_1729240 [compost metagenome]
MLPGAAEVISAAFGKVCNASLVWYATGTGLSEFLFTNASSSVAAANSVRSALIEVITRAVSSLEGRMLKLTYSTARVSSLDSNCFL